MANESLWNWQDAEAARLRREGKDTLARCWEDFASLVEDTEALGEAAELARELGEPRFELLFRHWQVQQGLFRRFANPQTLRAVAERLELLRRHSACLELPQRFCAVESLFNLRQAEDAPGHASDGLRMAGPLAGQVHTTLECHGCFQVMRIQALLDLGRADEAVPAIEALLASESEDNLRFLGLLLAAAAAEARGDAEAMRRWLDQAQTLGRDGGVNPDNEWFLLELQVRAALLGGDLEAAERLLETSSIRPPAHSAEAIRTRLALARGHAAAGAHAAARKHAEAAAECALERGLVRLAAEAQLLAAEACLALGATHACAAHAALLANLLPQLRSRDLDARGRAVGAAD